MRNDERRLGELYRALAAEDRKTLLAFGEFLASRNAAPVPDMLEPLRPIPLPRPREESVVGAIKRLSQSYYMIDRSTLLNDTSALMGAHLLQGRPLGEVIDELEDLFARRYAEYREQHSPPKHSPRDT